jgi:hypothetical protein
MIAMIALVLICTLVFQSLNLNECCVLILRLPRCMTLGHPENCTTTQQPPKPVQTLPPRRPLAAWLRTPSACDVPAAQH